ncbi:DUF4172 domain-containing protein [Pseudomonas syringae]|nr:DUF4172 domain-containing protein [Pseudomonas syringae]
MSSPYWIWQNPEWPHFTWQAEQFGSVRASLPATAEVQTQQMGWIH